MKQKIIFIVLLFNFLFVISLGATISMHKADIQALNGFMSEGPEKLDDLKELTEEIEERLIEIKELLDDTEREKPLKSLKKGGVTFNYYDGNIIIYSSLKGKGIKLGEKEKLFFKDKGISYTLTDKYYYSEYLVVDKKTKEPAKLKWLSVGGYEYWENANSQYGFKKKGKDGSIVYKIYTVESSKDTLYKITLENKSGLYFSRKSAKKIKYYTFLPDRGIKTKAESSILYYISNKRNLGYYLNNKNRVMLLDKFAGYLYVGKSSFAEKRVYAKELVSDFSDYSYAKCLKLVVDNRISFRNPGRIILFLINNARKSYKLSPLRSNNIMRKMSRKHLSYIFANEPKNLHSQEKGKKGFFGKTVVERGKNMRYPNKLVEWVVRGNDPIRHFIDATGNGKLLSSFLNPNARHFVQSSRINRGGVRVLVSLIGIRGFVGVGSEEKEEKLADKVEDFVESYREKNKNKDSKELKKLFWE